MGRQVLGDGGEQRVDRLALDVVRWLPSDPLVTFVLGDFDFNDAGNPCQKVPNFLLENLSRMLSVGDLVLQVKLKGGVEPALRRSDSGFLFHFAIGGFQIGFLCVTMALRKIPPIMVTHK